MSELEKVFAKPDLLLRSEHSLCPGCGEPVALRIILELITELGVRERTICVAGIGCYTAFRRSWTSTSCRRSTAARRRSRRA
jgi:pyruvate/2-oxoacid:ferredoxin oxidoreductase beta subunit